MTLIKHKLTLRGLLGVVDQSAVLDILDQKHERGRNRESYARVIASLLKLRRQKAPMPLYVRERDDGFGDGPYTDVCALNPRYKAPASGLKPYWGNRPPPGCYNAFLKKYTRTYGIDFTPRADIIDASIYTDKMMSDEEIAAEILWEITFYSFDEAGVKALSRSLKKTVRKIKKTLDRKGGKK